MSTPRRPRTFAPPVSYVFARFLASTTGASVFLLQRESLLDEFSPLQVGLEMQDRPLHEKLTCRPLPVRLEYARSGRAATAGTRAAAP